MSYRITSPLKDFKFLLEHNRSHLTFLEVCYMIGAIRMSELEKFRGMALRGELK